jgi:hypothetical protein
MPSSTEVDELHQLVTDLRKCVTSVVAKYGECPVTRRVENDAERILNGIRRLDIEIEALELTKGLTQPTACAEMIQIPDTQYDHDFWQDVDHEGIGGQNGACVGVSRNGKRRFG